MKDAARIFEIHNRLSTGGTLIPPALGYIFDSECRTPDQMREIAKRSRGLAVFLNRRMYENYLLHPKAIVDVASAIESFRDGGVSEEVVRAAIDARRRDRKYYCSADPAEMSDDQWFKRIHAAVVLSEIFNELSEKRVAYDKVVHSVELTRWLIEHSPGDLREIADLLVGIVANPRQP